jgi:hypothetical protein
VCISNLDRLGRTEVELVNLVIYGAARLVEMEELLGVGKSIEPAVAALTATQRRAESGFAYVFSNEHSNLARREEPCLPDDDPDDGEAAVDSSVVVVEPPAHYQNDVAPPVAAPVEAATDAGLGAGHSSQKSKSSTCAVM